MQTEQQTDTRSQLTRAGSQSSAARGPGSLCAWRGRAPLLDFFPSAPTKPLCPMLLQPSSTSGPETPSWVVHLEFLVPRRSPPIPPGLPLLTLLLCHGPRGSAPQCHAHVAHRFPGGQKLQGKGRPWPSQSLRSGNLSSIAPRITSLWWPGYRAREQVPLGLERSQKQEPWSLRAWSTLLWTKPGFPPWAQFQLAVGVGPSSNFLGSHGRLTF